MSRGAELHIAGVQVARGYLNHPDLTAERFHTGPDGTGADTRMYADKGRPAGRRVAVQRVNRLRKRR